MTMRTWGVPHPTLLALCVLALTLGACGSVHSGQDPDAAADALAPARTASAPAHSTAAPAHSTPAPAHSTAAPAHSTPAPAHSTAAPTLSTPPPAHSTPAPTHLTPAPAQPALSANQASARAALAAAVVAARQAYNRETKGSKLQQETARLAADAILLGALARGDVAGARAEAQAQLVSLANHFDHVTRISVLRGSRVLVNATVNSDGVYVVAPARRELTLHGRHVGTLLVSIQDVTGFVKLVHRRTSAEVVARGGSGQVRESLPAAARARLPHSGAVTIAGRHYLVRSFGEVGWGGEPLTVWILVPG
jgi:hypothetical protein